MSKKILTRTTLDPGAQKYVLAGSTKFVDTDRNINRSGKMAQYWNKRGFAQYWKSISNVPGPMTEQYFKQDPERALIKHFNLKELEFGNWENNETRFNYVFASIIALYDLNRVLNFGLNMGFGVLSLSFGARGSGKALAHFEPSNMIINITRYKRADRISIDLPDDLEQRNKLLFLNSGGMGSLAHEYGHFLDVLGGNFFEKGNFFGLTKGLSTDYNFDKSELNQTTMRGLTNTILNTLVNDPKTGNYTSWFEKLKKDYSNNQYWFRQAEIFARAFENYIQHKLEKQNIQNKLLTKPKYERSAYPGPDNIKKIVPYFDKLLKLFATRAKNKQLSLSL